LKSVPRILPLVGVAIGGVLAVNAISGARDLPGLLSGAQAWAEEAAKPAAKGDKKDPAKGEKPEAGKEGAAPAATDPAVALPAASIAPKAVCAPTAAELAKQAGLSPAELQVLQSLGARRGQLDARENDLNTQLALMAAAEAKLDAKIKALNGLKAEVNGLLNQSNAKEAAEIDRLVKVFEGMKAKDAAPRLAALDDSVRIPIAAKMKERALSAIVAQMPAAEAKKLTEALARRFSDAQAAAAKASAAAAQTQAQPKVASVDPTQPEAAPKRPAAPARKPAPRKKAPATQQAAAKPPAAAPAAAPATPAAPQPYQAPPAAPPAAKAG
jgi:flagellar motility protein MotE (MotC chaperone)